MSKLAVEQAAQLVSLLPSVAGDPVELVDGDAIVAVVISPDYLAALHATQSLLATTGSLAAIDEGLADLKASRADDWRRLRTDYGRGDPDEIALLLDEGAAVLASHRARWDLDLLPPAVAERCFDLLDTWRPDRSHPLGHPLTAGVSGLSLVDRDGYRLVHRLSPAGLLELVHIAASPD